MVEARPMEIPVRPGDITIAEDGSVRINNPELAERVTTIVDSAGVRLLAPNQACNNWVAACGCEQQ